MILDFNDDDSEESDFVSIAGEDNDFNLNHYRVAKLSNYGPFGTNHPPRTRGNREQVKFSNEGKIMSLIELAAQKVACHLPFGLVEHYDTPVPEPMQCRIAFWSFPQDEEDVKLYTCLANGNADFFYRAEELICQNAVRDMLQVGFHLSANVQFLSETESLEFFRVAITFDRRRITTCSCSCMTSTFWCQHVVAVCLQRIRKPHEAKLRAPVSESLQRLEKNQLQKFAQYLINELPQQILPAAQKLLDELLSGGEAVINKNPAAPDPTAGATINEQTSWCLDYTHLSMDIHKILLKQCTTQPTVCSDIQSLHATAPPATTEYSQLLRPIRGREPEGIWNLISIVGEMMKRRDSNLFNLLEVMTEEIMKFEKIVSWWFETKVSLHSGFAINLAATKSSQCTSQYSCSNFCDEIVHLWRLAALNPSASNSDRQQLQKKYFDWHLTILKRHSSLLDNNVHGIKSTQRNLLELFPGFKPAIEGCQIDWSDWDEKKGRLVSISETDKAGNEGAVKTAKKRRRRSRASKPNSIDQKPSTSTSEQTSVNSTSTQDEDDFRNLRDEDEENKSENQHQLSGHDQLVEQRVNAEVMPLLERNDEQVQEPDPAVPELEHDLRVYFMDRQLDTPNKNQKPESFDDLIKSNPKRLADPLEILYAKTEGLHAHGHLDEARKMAKRVACEILSQRNYPSLRQLFTLPRRRKKKASLDAQMSIVAYETLMKIGFLCHVLSECPENRGLIFKLILFGVEMKRPPAATKPLEVKLINQKQELIQMLKNIILQEEEILVLRQKAEAICDRDGLDTQPDVLTTLLLGNYVFEALVLTRTPIPKSSSDVALGFQAALSALGTKINVSETDHPLLCEGIRRQRGELALALISFYKDDQEKLDLILKQLLDKDLIAEVNPTGDKCSSLKKNVFNQHSNHASEAAAHFMFELAKTVFDKAGGSSNTAHLFRPQVVAQNGGRGIHRKLHMCTLRIALYALGLQNRTSANWMLRTYNGRASFIHEQALEIGLPAIKFLSENWEGYLTPVEVASIADKAGCLSDAETKRIAAQMAKSCLKYANFLDHNAVSRILVQCKEQTIEMIEEACSEIEQVAEKDSVCADVLFTTARAWHGLYLKLTTDERHGANANLYQLNNLTPSEQDTGAAGWLSTSGQSLCEKHQQAFNDPLHPPVWNIYIQTDFILSTDTPIYKNVEYVRAAFRVGIKALDSLKLSTHMGSKHNSNKLDEILWLLGISKSLGRDYLYNFSKSIVKNITDLTILSTIAMETIRFFGMIRLPEDHIDRVNIFMPIYDKCLERCLKQTKDLMKHSSYDQKFGIENILDIVQALTTFTQELQTAQYYWEILKFVEFKMEKRIGRRNRVHINIGDRRIWFEKFTRENLKVCPCDECWNNRGSNLRPRFKTLYQSS